MLRFVSRLNQPYSFNHLRLHLHHLRLSFNHVYSRTTTRSCSSSVFSRDTVDLEIISKRQMAYASVVKIFTIISMHNPRMPWQNQPQEESSGCGFVISGKRILTNAHVVADNIFVQVWKIGSQNMYRAEVEAISHDCDLAILVVKGEESQEFWKGLMALEFGGIPLIYDKVSVVGYSIGGENICVTEGKVCKIGPANYAHSNIELLTISIDAAINCGNSGGPVFLVNSLAVVGVAFQGNEENNTVIPVTVIKHFIDGVDERGKHDGFGSMGLICQSIQNSQLRKHLGMTPHMTGVLVCNNNPSSYASHVLRKHDILLSIDHLPISNDGSVPFRIGGLDRIPLDHLVSMKKPMETARVKLLRDGEELEFSILLHRLELLDQLDELPSYFIFAGLVFLPKETYGQQKVFLTQVLPHDINVGYEVVLQDIQEGRIQVMEVNGVAVENLKHLYKLVEDCDRESIRFDLDYGRLIVLNYERAKAATSLIMKEHRIPFAFE